MLNALEILPKAIPIALKLSRMVSSDCTKHAALKNLEADTVSRHSSIHLSLCEAVRDPSLKKAPSQLNDSGYVV